jgi:ABC-2 type transport system ATP-binding protein
MSTALALAPVLVLLAAFEVLCVVDIARHESRLLPRWGWLVACLASVPLGGIVYLLVGRGEARHPAGAAREPPPTGPAVPGVPRGAEPPSGPIPTRHDGSAFAVRTTDLHKRYGAHAALDGVSLDVPRGSVFGLVGPNGAGKTTLLGILAGLRRPTSGGVVLGVDAQRVALLPDTPHFEPWLTAFEVVELARALTVAGSGPGRSADVLAEVGLVDAAHRPTGGFSRGMLQRLGLAATIVGRPELLLLDEPCSALDPLGRREVLDLVGRLGDAHTVLFCSHILDDVQEVCDRVGVLRDGRVLFQGPVRDLLVGAAAPEYTIRLRAPVAPVVAELARQPWVRAVEQVGAEEIHVRAASLDEAERHLVAALAGIGARVVSMVPAGADLEQVFLALTGNGDRP